MNQISTHRKALEKTRSRIEEGRLTVGYIGGSITDERPRHNWPESVSAWFLGLYPSLQLTVENAGIGATGSDLAVFRAEKELIDRGCNLVFVEFAVNDFGEPSDKRMRTREGLLRKLLKDGSRDVVLVYTYMQDMYADMSAGRVPASIAEFEQLAEHYGIGSVWMGLHAMEEIKRGKLRWEEWLPDGLHPASRGSLCYGESVIAFLEQSLSQPQDRSVERHDCDLPNPIAADNWEHADILPLHKIHREGPWILHRWRQDGFIDQVLETSAPGAKLSFTFAGRGLALAFDFGKRSGEFRYRIDHGDWKSMVRERYYWVGDAGWYRLSLITEQLPAGDHHFELEVTHGNQAECTGTDCKLALVGIIR